jgi:hypothetical protein
MSVSVGDVERLNAEKIVLDRRYVGELQKCTQLETQNIILSQQLESLVKERDSLKSEVDSWKSGVDPDGRKFTQLKVYEKDDQ